MSAVRHLVRLRLGLECTVALLPVWKPRMTTLRRRLHC